MKDANPADSVPPRATRQKTGGVCSDLVAYWRIFQMAILLGLSGSFSLGFQMSMISFASPFIKALINETLPERYKVPVDEQTLTLLWSLTVSIFTIGGLAGVSLSRYLLAKYSRKKYLVFSNLFALIAAVILGTSKVARSFEMILLGRFLHGFNIGLNVIIQAQFLTEISPKHLRGMVNVMLTIFSNLGKLLGPVVGHGELLATESLWPLLLMCTGTLGLLTLVTLPFFPESPTYLLIQKGDPESSLKALKQFWGDGYRQAEALNLLEEQTSIRQGKSMTVLQVFRDRSLRCQLYLMLLMITAVPMCGSSAIYLYVSDILRATGLAEWLIPYAALSLGLCELSSTIICFFIIERVGRRKLMLWGYGLMVVILALLTATISLQDQAPWTSYVSIALIFLFIILFGIGPASVTFPIIVELFQQSSRAAAFAISHAVFWAGSSVTGLLFPYLLDYTNNFCFLVFMGYTAIIWVFLYRFLPETMGKSFADLQRELTNLRSRRKVDSAVSRSVAQEVVKCTKL